MRKTTFAVVLGNRGFFPGELMAQARVDLTKRLEELGYGCLMTPPDETRFGAVETREEGARFARFLRENAGSYDGVIVSLPNFGDENGIFEAVRDCGVPILIQAYPDELDRMDPAHRRDAFCGKMSVMDVLRQNGICFTSPQPHVIDPASERFDQILSEFGATCRVVNGTRKMRVGAIGARTSAFKTVRFDEGTAQLGGITVETMDLSTVFNQMETLDSGSAVVRRKVALLQTYSTWCDAPDDAIWKIARLGVVLDDIIQDQALDAIALRCWVEFQTQLKISPCVVLSMLNNVGIPAACEVDVGNAIMMRMLGLASEQVTTCLDWNNNYGDETDKCILFHCGPVPQEMMVKKGVVKDHAILANVVGPGNSCGCNTGRIKPGPFTFGSLLTEGGKIKGYVGQGEFTDDVIPDNFFGCAGVARIIYLQRILQAIGYSGHRHHTSATPGFVATPIEEAFTYLGNIFGIANVDRL